MDSPASPMSPASPFSPQGGRMRGSKESAMRGTKEAPSMRGGTKGLTDRPRVTISTYGSKSSTGGLPEIHSAPTSPGVSPTKDIRKKVGEVPLCIQNLDFWKAMDYFEQADSLKRGELDKKQFASMLMAINRSAHPRFQDEDMNDDTAHHYFDDVDVDGSNSIDKEEFLAWAYQTYSNYCKSVRKRLASMDSKKVVTWFRQIDKDGNGVLDKDEFVQFVQKFAPDSGLSVAAIKDLFKFIDQDHSGEVDVNEFLDWVHPERKIAAKGGGLPSPGQRPLTGSASTPEVRNMSKLPTQAARYGSKLQALPARVATKESAQKKENILSSATAHIPHTGGGGGLFEGTPGDPVLLEFTIGKDFEATIIGIKKELRKEYDASQISFEVKYDENVTKCSCLMAKVGRGIVLWDKPKMIPYMEDPFLSIQSARKWISSVLAKTLPDLIKAANLDSRGTDHHHHHKHHKEHKGRTLTKQ